MANLPRLELRAQRCRGQAQRARPAAPGWGLMLWLCAGMAWPAPAQAGPATTPPPAKDHASAAGTPLLLDVRVNGQAFPRVVEALRLPDGRLVLPSAEWKEMRLRAPADTVPLPGGQSGHALEAVHGLQYQLHSRRLLLEITAPPALFMAQTMNAGTRTGPTPARPDPGVLFNYDVVASTTSGGGTGGMLEAVVFGPYGTLVTSVLASSQGNGGRRFQRLDTAWQMDWPQDMHALVVGDTVGTGGGWSRPVRFGGVRFGRDFSLQPGFVTVPQAALAGSAALPSAVEVLVNGQQRLSQAVQPGAFEVANVPLLNGAGQINLVVRDLLGRETVVQQNYYSSPRILAPGLSDYLFEAGRLRTGYGAGSATYGEVFSAATWRQGFENKQTGEVRAEWTRSRQAGGLELTRVLGEWGLARASLAFSRTPGLSGTRWSAGVERHTAHGGWHMTMENYAQGFTQFAAVAGETAPRQRFQWSGFMPLWGRVSAAATYTRQRSWNAADVGVWGLTISMPVLEKSNLSLSFARQMGERSGWRLGMSLAMPLGPDSHAVSSIDRNGDGRLAATLQYSQAAPAGPGLGWYARVAESPAATWTAGMNLNTAHAEYAVDAEGGRGTPRLRVGARGTLGYAGGLGFASRPLGREAFAVVRVGDLADVPVLRSHQVVAHTNASGLALVPRLLPYEANQIAIDLTNMPMDVEVDNPRLTLVPYARSAAVADFGVKRSRMALVHLVQADGDDVPAGARVHLPGVITPFTVARRGEVYLTGLQDDNEIAVHWADHACAVRLSLAAAQHDTLPRIGPLVCRKVRQL